MPPSREIPKKDERSFEERLLQEMEGTEVDLKEPAVIEEPPQEEIEAQKKKLIQQTSDEEQSKKNTGNN